MGRDIKRVDCNNAVPVGVHWEGYLNPHYGARQPCPACGGTGASPRARIFEEQWYGNAPFDPASTGSTLFTTNEPAIRELAERNCQRTPGHFGYGDSAVEREARRLADHFNPSWCHHLSQEDVDALIAGGRLRDFTQDFVRGEGWVDKDPVPQVSAREVNVWSLRGMGHDALNRWICVRARCEREGVPEKCATCDGDGDWWPSEEAKALYESWEQAEPPAGDGWQVWENVSEGSPVTPAFATAEELIDYLVKYGDAWDQHRGDGGWNRENAECFVKRGFAMSILVSGGEVLAPRDGMPV